MATNETLKLPGTGAKLGPQGSLGPSISQDFNIANNSGDLFQRVDNRPSPLEQLLHQSTVPAMNAINKMARQLSGFTGDSGDSLQEQVWGFQPNGGDERAEELLQAAGYFAYTSMQLVLVRIELAPSFLVLLDPDMPIDGWDYPPDMTIAQPANKMPGESDVDMLNRLLGDLATWEENYNGTQYPGARVTWNAPFQGGDFYYAPEADLASIYHLWDYTPSSGPPVRNGITDSMQIFALLPVNY